VCACCGAPVAVWKQKTFSWYPKWTLVGLLGGVLVFAILAAVMTKRTSMAVPLCEQHRGHFWKRGLLLWLGFLGLFFLGFVCASIAGSGHHREWVWFVLPIYFLVWIVAAAIAGSSAIRAVQITDMFVRMRNVSDAFVAAHQALGPVPMPGMPGMPMQMPYGMPPPA
jgi:hypothetical protein